jgi:hypothetical protein
VPADTLMVTGAIGAIAHAQLTSCGVTHKQREDEPCAYPQRQAAYMPESMHLSQSMNMMDMVHVYRTRTAACTGEHGAQQGAWKDTTRHCT